MENYLPHLTQPDGFTPTDREMIQQNIAIHNLTHVRTKTGETFGIRVPLNEKSIPLNDASTLKTRVNYPSVESFGIIEDNASEDSPLIKAVRDLHDQGVTMSVDLAPGIQRDGTTAGEHIKQAVDTVQGNADGNPVNDQGETFGKHLDKVIHKEASPGEWQPAPSGPPVLPVDIEGAGEQEAPADNIIKHEDRAHAILSASGASRWLACPPSALLEAALPDSTSDAAAEGTAAHELAEHKLRVLMGMPSTRPESHWHDEDMESHTDDYADCCMAELAETKKKSPAAFLSIEERLDFSHIVPAGFGTGDTVIVGDDTMTIIDLKYGKGVKVDAVENPQMKLYALGALNMYGFIYNIQKVRMIIFQPRLNNISVWETTVEDLLEWAEDVVKPTANLAIKGEGAFTPGEHCGFCRYAPQCEALMQQHFSVVPDVLTAPIVEAEPAGPPEPGELTDEQIAQVVIHADAIKKWLTKVESHAKKEAANGNIMPGLKLVAGRSNRRWTDTTAVAEKAQEHGIDPYKPRELVGLGDMQKRFGGKKAFDAALSELIHKPEGAPTLVPDTDPRPALQVATPDNVFQPIKETT
ncbi:exonuclease [Corynebacterium phage CL31]|nr:exonuclease [Corynebacterium phage CL31]